ncbi:MAG TPA: Kiwa anti-phage protein KwaB-like domain-containing protein [Candidatus Saccharimonadales bacterium]|nr:Kiwa anti-phage protein KwaB-like domain-containing protein [Candidatus Saccharimonadales bacterium]
MEQDILAPDTAAIDNYHETDVFAWANNLVRLKDELRIHLFLVDKRNMPYRTSLGGGLSKQLEPLFVDGILEYILSGAETGLSIRGFEEAEAEEGVLQRTQVFKVPKARELFNFINTQEHEIEIFNDAEHDFSRIKGIVARVTHPELAQSVYIAKVLPQPNIMRGKVGWMMRDGKFVPFDADGAVRIPNDNQLLILDQDLYVFHPGRLKQLFSYDAKEAFVAEQKVAAIQASFRLSFPEGISLQRLVEGKRSTIKKLQLIDPESVKQQELMDHAEEMGIDLMQDESGAIIIMDGKDLDTFVNLLNDDYVESNLTGQRYEIIRKKPLKPPKDDTAQA